MNISSPNSTPHQHIPTWMYLEHLRGRWENIAWEIIVLKSHNAKICLLAGPVSLLQRVPFLIHFLFAGPLGQEWNQITTLTHQFTTRIPSVPIFEADFARSRRNVNQVQMMPLLPPADYLACRSCSFLPNVHGGNVITLSEH